MFCSGVLILLAIEHGYKYICFIHASNIHETCVVTCSYLYSSAKFSKLNMEKRCRNEIIIIIMVTVVYIVEICIR